MIKLAAVAALGLLLAACTPAPRVGESAAPSRLTDQSGPATTTYPRAYSP
ncbi:hypothetical protein [Teichococcus deserti]|nr:hypothetical protein [Pseudoroseomonas deserti]